MAAKRVGLHGMCVHWWQLCGSGVFPAGEGGYEGGGVADTICDDPVWPHISSGGNL